MKRPEFTHWAVGQLRDFLRMMGFEAYQNELEHFLFEMKCKQDKLLNTGYDTSSISGMLKTVEQNFLEYKKSVLDLEKCFGFYLDKVTIAPPKEPEENGGAQ